VFSSMRVGRCRIPSKSIKAPNDGSHSHLAGVRVGEAYSVEKCPQVTKNH
jgi:hypothetical protein